MPDAVLRRMVRGVSRGNDEEVVDNAGNGFGMQKSSDGRSFIHALNDSVRKLAERCIDDVRFEAIMVDGVKYARDIHGSCLESNGIYLGYRPQPHVGRKKMLDRK